MGGASYKDTFSLPHTETASVSDLLEDAGLNNLNGASGTAVLKNKSGAFTEAPAQLQPTLTKLCAAGDHVAMISTPWQSITCAKAADVQPGDPQLLNSAKGSTTA